ncbi:MAG: YdiU family protein [Desulfuromonadaceae bacterium]|nr:YdiU family protein [Desulfuromonadaceae bacterium]
MMKDCGFNFDNSYTKLPETFYTRIAPVRVQAPEMVIFNHELANAMGLDCSELTSGDMAALFAGNKLPEGAEPLAQAYAGHQFGHFTMLGDGRAVVWGEHITPDGNRLDIQFKGSGRTPYSRSGDGRAALGPMLREYIISEAMYHLGIPTTRGLAVIKTGEPVMREDPLPGAILTRVSSSHIRVGTFEFAAAKGDQHLVQALLNYTIERHYPDLIDSDTKAIALLNAVMEKQADLIVHWMRTGFIHGVMNTDNVTLSGETIDYGPCAFMDAYDPNTVFSSIDHMGRYAYANQSKITQWNIARLAEALLPLIHADMNKAVKIAEEEINTFAAIYQDKWLTMMRAKLGLFDALKSDARLIADLLGWMQTNHADFTNTFRDLSQAHKPASKIYAQKSFTAWYERWKARLQQNTQPLESSLCLMKSNNPAVIPRNHKVEEALAAAYMDDLKPFHALLNVLKEPYKNSDIPQAYQAPPLPSERVYQTFCGT